MKVLEYEVTITRTYTVSESLIYPIEASSEDEARDLVESLYYDGEFDDMDFKKDLNEENYCNCKVEFRAEEA